MYRNTYPWTLTTAKSVAAQEVGGAEVEAFSNHLMSIFGPREDDVAMIALRRISLAG
jgi:hypothetical protein